MRVCYFAQSEKLKDVKRDWFGEKVVETEAIGWGHVPKGLVNFCKWIPYSKAWESIPGIAFRADHATQNLIPASPYPKKSFPGALWI